MGGFFITEKTTHPAPPPLAQVLLSLPMGFDSCGKLSIASRRIRPMDAPLALVAATGRAAFAAAASKGAHARLLQTKKRKGER